MNHFANMSQAEVDWRHNVYEYAAINGWGSGEMSYEEAEARYLFEGWAKKDL